MQVSQGIFVLVGEELLHEVVSVLGHQLLAVLALHNRPVIVIGVWGELVQVSERVQH